MDMNPMMMGYIMQIFMMGFLAKMVKSMFGGSKKLSSSKALIPYGSTYYQTLIEKATPMMTGPEEPYNTAIGKPVREVIYIPVKRTTEIPETKPVEEPVREPVKVPARVGRFGGNW